MRSPQPNGELTEKLKNQVLQWSITPVGQYSMVVIPVPLNAIGAGVEVARELVGTVVGLPVKRTAVGVETGEGDVTVDEGKEYVAVTVVVEVPVKITLGVSGKGKVEGVEERDVVGTVAVEAVRRLGAVDRRKRTRRKNAFMAVLGWMDGLWV